MSQDEDRRRYQTGRHLGGFLLLLVAIRADHGASLIERLRGLQAPPLTVDTGRVYRALRTLEQEGALSSTWTVADGEQPVRVYRLTPAGRERLDREAAEIRARRDGLDRFLAMWRELGGDDGPEPGP